MTNNNYSKEELIEPIFFSGGKIGIVLIHGFTACPTDMRPLAEKLHYAYGYTVLAPLLKGHGLSPEEMKSTNWKDWAESAAEAVGVLRSQCEKVVGIGHSMGGLIALHLAAEGRLDGVVSINAPIIYREQDWHFAYRLLGKQEYIDKPEKKGEITINSEGLPHYSYIRVPLKCFISLNEAILQVQGELYKISCPALIVQGLEDKTADPASGRVIDKGITNSRKDVIYWAKEDHYIVLSSARNKLAEKIQRFLLKYNLGSYN